MHAERDSAWNGAALFASLPSFCQHVMSKSDYDEYGPHRAYDGIAFMNAAVFCREDSGKTRKRTRGRSENQLLRIASATPVPPKSFLPDNDTVVQLPRPRPSHGGNSSVPPEKW